MKLHLSSLLILITILFGYSQETKKVLFLGNSYTAANNLPSLVSNMALSTGDLLVYDSNTPGGYRFLNHDGNATTLTKIQSNNWDYVALQAQSQETSLTQAQMEVQVFPFANSLSNTIRENYECSQPLFYMTWGRENGDTNNCSVRPWVCTYESMDNVIRATYISMANTNHSEIAPVGAVWRYLRENHPSLDLYSNDGSHPSLTGSYAAACAFYTMIYKKDPTLITWNSSLSTSDANLIKLATKTIVYDALSNWDFTLNLALSNFTEVINSNQVVFTNTSNSFDTILWDFGDGNTTTNINPTHTYENNGDYLVSLTTTKCGKSHTKTKTITINNALSLDDKKDFSINIFPNPVSKELIIKFNKEFSHVKIELLNVLGKITIEKTFINTKTIVVDLSHLNSQVYLLNIKAENQTYSTKIIKN